MSPAQTFVWGAAGALLAYLAAILLPELRAHLRTKRPTLTSARLLLLMLVLVIHVAAGGIFAVILGDATLPKHAAFYGAGWEGGIIKGAVELGRYLRRN